MPTTFSVLKENHFLHSLDEATFDQVLLKFSFLFILQAEAGYTTNSSFGGRRWNEKKLNCETAFTLSLYFHPRQKFKLMRSLTSVSGNFQVRSFWIFSVSFSFSTWNEQLAKTFRAWNVQTCEGESLTERQCYSRVKTSALDEHSFLHVTPQKLHQNKDLHGLDQ